MILNLHKVPKIGELCSLTRPFRLSNVAVTPPDALGTSKSGSRAKTQYPLVCTIDSLDRHNP